MPASMISEATGDTDARSAMEQRIRALMSAYAVGHTIEWRD
jgi:hypothetical protein